MLGKMPDGPLEMWLSERLALKALQIQSESKQTTVAQGGEGLWGVGG